MFNDIQLSREAGCLVNKHGLWLATAESCTGGLLGHLITSIGGSSEYYLGGFISYSNYAKERWLGVSTETLMLFGAVSKETVLEMARGVRTAFGEKPEPGKIIGISISGVAGPGGGTSEKPVGTVWIGISSGKGDGATCFHFSGNREEIKAQSARQALEILITNLSQ